jgi:hypothetical protein
VIVIVQDEVVNWPETLFIDEYERPDGLHLGTIQRWLRQRMQPIKGGEGFKDMKLTAEIGLLWEDVLSLVMGNKYAVRPPPIEVDGIWLSPDGLNSDPEGKVPMVVEEYKATWKSVNRPIQDDYHYMMQLQSYCYGYETNVGLMRVFYLMGDYKGSGPLYRVSRIEFTRKELETNWNTVLRLRSQM